ncbi:uncharacterized protein STEHIDRAFT_58585 [Stereum hirsutum FP-91666 SS1]|uniref:uncharacterized protein n=1 Tax=Stereum hirsutum (strain FP-91666) TaxID=721885 RepID=UPI000444A47A|nr:uncharacterized protein STEHIDRAFT_58585 [Stereum hirsutum FP-91666 SS1]EIM86009.1 hypothetical protein STEHIDRAFT_58585 [Stereum hirsutum FP-91666 SS1]
MWQKISLRVRACHPETSRVRSSTFCVAWTRDRRLQVRIKSVFPFPRIPDIHVHCWYTDVSKQPIPQAPATSAAAWSPLLRAHLDHIQPTVDRWRGTLDTILVFVALFSAIVTTFFVQSLEGLSQDPGDRTNELLLNLTELVIAVSGVNASHLTIQPPTAFEPEESAVRLNFYWSISLILSVRCSHILPHRLRLTRVIQ